MLPSGVGICIPRGRGGVQAPEQQLSEEGGVRGAALGGGGVRQQFGAGLRARSELHGVVQRWRDWGGGGWGGIWFPGS